MRRRSRRAVTDERDLLERMFRAAIAAADPAVCVPPHLPEKPKGRTIVVGAGKAAASMAKAVEEHWDGPLEGLVVTRYGHAVPTRTIEVVEAAHPTPDAAGLAAARRMMALVSGLSADDLVLCLISGGGSALLTLPADGLTLADKQAINRALLRSGASIHDMNCVRKHLSAIKGGRLALACAPARVVSLLISDVPGDDPSVIASGPTVADPTSCADALAILRRYGVSEPRAVVEALERACDETPKPGDPRLARCETVMIATALQSLDAAADVARAAGCEPLVLGDSIGGEARDVATTLAGIARHVALRGEPVRPPCVLISGGETTVTVRGKGRGGRNAEFLLALAVSLDGHPAIHALAGDTDGVDGAVDVAAYAYGPDTLRRAAELGLRAKERLADNDGYGFFAPLHDAIVAGPTLTNVNDFRAILIRQL
ncbi:MAG: glycerate kinase [Rhizobiales bacterium]|nr:glycerate kinase [Hyphomicrobiales bacterium]